MKEKKVTRVARGHQTYTHDLWKAKVALMIKDHRPYKRFQPLLERHEHTHIFHSCDRDGEIQKYTTAVGGHFHEIITKENPDGSLEAKCGPPLQKIQKKGKGNNTVTKIVPITFEVDPEKDPLVDDHSHEMMYMGSEELSQAKTNAILMGDAEKYKSIGQAPKAKVEA